MQGDAVDTYSNEKPKHNNAKESIIIKEIATKLHRLDCEEAVDYVKNLRIPDSSNELVDFFVFATSNINLLRYKFDSPLSSDEQELSDAWEWKFNQAYEKAMITLANTPEYNSINMLYTKKKDELAQAKERNKKNNKLFYISIAVFMLCLFAILIFVVISRN